MKLSDIRIGVPLLQLKTRISHSNPRRAMAFERVILDMARHFSRDPSLGGITLQRIFTDILCVPDPDPLVLPTLYELMDLGVISPRTITSLDALTMHDIEITGLGREMMDNGMMIPSKLAQEDRTFHFDPIGGRLLSEEESRSYIKTKPGISIDSSEFEGVFPEVLIRTSLEQSPAADDYGKIEKIELESARPLWKEYIFSVELDSGSIKIVLKGNDSLNRYLASIDADKFYSTFIDPVFDYGKLSADQLEKADGNDAENLRPVSYVLSNWPENAPFVLPGPAYDSACIPEQAPPRQAIIIHDESCSEDISMEWNRNLSGCKIFVKAPHPAKDSFLLTNSSNTVCRHIRVHYNNVPRSLIVASCTPSGEENRILNDVLSGIPEKIRSLPNFREQLFLWRKFLDKIGWEDPSAAENGPGQRRA